MKEHPDAWTRVDTILEFSQNMNTKVSLATRVEEGRFSTLRKSCQISRAECFTVDLIKSISLGSLIAYLCVSPRRQRRLDDSSSDRGWREGVSPQKDALPWASGEHQPGLFKGTRH